MDTADRDSTSIGHGNDFRSFSLLFVVALPFCLAFSIFRYRLLDVNLVFDWVMAHAVILGLFSLIELAFWTGWEANLRRALSIARCPSF